PVTIDIYTDAGKPMRKEVFVNQRTQNFEFDVPSEPKLVNFNADRTLLAEITENKTDANYIHQYYNAPTFMDRYEALQELAASDNAAASSVFKDALKDKFYGLRSFALYQVDMEEAGMAEQMKKVVENDPKAEVRSAALDRLIELGDPSYGDFFEKIANNDPAASVKSSALLGVASLYVTRGDIQALEFFQNNWKDFDFYDAINFFDLYAELAKQGSPTDMVNSANDLKEVAMTANSLWQRFGATKAINTLHATLAEKEGEASGEEATQFTTADDQILTIIKEIKAAEKDPQLQQIYMQLPQP
ncbi:MAG: hypothetical protein AAFO82_13120, partial [Bacteroidota bacterium]